MLTNGTLLQNASQIFAMQVALDKSVDINLTNYP